MRIGYVLKRYPRLSETFIVQEILQMEQRGADLVIFAIMDPHESLRNPAVNQVRAPVIYLQRSFLGDLAGMISDHARLLIASPQGYRRAVAHLLRSRFWSRATLRAFMQAGRLAQRARQLNVDRLHAHFAHNPASLARYASLFIGIPYSFTAHAKDLYLSRPESLVNKAELSAFITTCTGCNARYLRSILPTREHAKIHTVYHGVDTERFRPPQFESPNQVPVLLSVGRLVPKKGFNYLVEAARLLRERGLAFRLDIYGSGPLRDELRKQMIGAGLNGVVSLRGACMQDELVAAYQTSDVFVLAPVVTSDGDRDGIPNVLLEAMASGLPPVSTEISGIPEVITHGDNGLLVPPGDAQALATALEALLIGPDLRTRLGGAARATTVNSFDASENAQLMTSLLGIERHVLAHSIRSS